MEVYMEDALQTIEQKLKLVKGNKFLIGYISHIGHKQTNDDATGFLLHPQKDSLKIFVVADGVSSSKNGSKAASYLKDELLKWFSELSPAYINTMATLKSVFWGKIREINKELIEMYNGLGETTLVCAITGDQETLIASSGDSRGYVISDNTLKQLTADHLVWYQYNDPKSIEKDDLRLLIGNSYISHSIGRSLQDYRPDVITISNDDYSALLLFTDGVTDILSDEKIKFIYDHNLPKDVLIKIINEAVNAMPELISPVARQRFKDRSYMINDYTDPGKDNATMLLYKKL